MCDIAAAEQTSAEDMLSSDPVNAFTWTEQHQKRLSVHLQKQAFRTMTQTATDQLAEGASTHLDCETSIWSRSMNFSFNRQPSAATALLHQLLCSIIVYVMLDAVNKAAQA